MRPPHPPLLSSGDAGRYAPGDMARVNLLRGFHRLLLVLWLAWVLTVIGYVTWSWWTDPWRWDERSTMVTATTGRGERVQVLLPCGPASKPCPPDGSQEERELLNARSTAERPECCWEPWSYPRYAFMRTFAWLVGWPGAFYIALLGVGAALRWVWRGLATGERKDRRRTPENRPVVDRSNPARPTSTEAMSTRCQICKEVLFVGDSDPLDHYLADLGGWGGVPLAVCLGSWRSLWRRKWYHQRCCGVFSDRTDLAGQWHIFGFTPFEHQRPKRPEPEGELDG
jgi:hypothetical protein